MDRNNWLLVLVVTGVTGTFFVQTARSPTSAPAVVQPGTKEGQSKEQAALPPRTFAHPLAEFLGIPVPPADRDPTTEMKTALKQQLEREVGNLEFLIYLVADPIDAQVSNRFDQQVDVLHKALAVDGFIPDRFFLPWKKDDKLRRHVHEPGVILFRRNGNGPRRANDRDSRQVTDLLVVFLVGETTTAGIHTEAFQRAAEHQQRLRELIPGSSRIRVCGPMFSGSGDSLARAIARLPDRPEVTVITGHAVSIDRERFRYLSDGTHIFGTVLHGQILKQALIDHVVARNWNCSRIAWLTETGTAYGSNIAFTGRHGSDQHAEQQMAGDRSGGPEVIEFPFPANIAQVRAAYEESRRKESKSKESLGGSKLRLSIPFAASEGATDMVPPLTPDVTAPTAEIILGQILSTIRNQHIKYVGISYTDPRDPLFIAAMIKEQCPNVQIMLVTSDVLHLHPEYSRIMHGSLVASSYPLYPEALTWCFPYGEHERHADLPGLPPHDLGRDNTSRNVVLSHQGMYGVYNALVMLRGIESGRYRLAGTSETVLLDSCEKVALPLCYGPPFHEPRDQHPAGLRPAVWVSRIGSSSFHPITARESAFEKDAAGMPRKRKHADYTLCLEISERKSIQSLHVHTQVPLSLCLVGLTWIVAGLFHLLIVSGTKRIDLGKWSRPLKIPNAEPSELNCLALVFRSIGTSCFIIMLGLLGSITLSSFPGLSFSLGSLAVMAECGCCYLLAVALGVALITDLSRAFPRGGGPTVHGSELGRHLLGARVTATGLIAVALLGYALVALVQGLAWGFREVDAYLWFSTAGDPWNGLSFLTTVQLPCVAVILLCHGMLVQLHFLSDDDVLKVPTAVTKPEDRDPAKIRNAILFPILARFQQRRSVVLSALVVLAVLWWLLYLMNETQGPDFFAMPLNFPCILWLAAAGFWFIRFFKLLHILEDFTRNLAKFAGRLHARWPDWKSMFENARLRRDGLEELFWIREIDTPEDQTRLANATTTQEHCAIEIDMYVRRMFFHFGRLMVGLVAAGCLLFLAAQSFPLSSEPLLRFTASAMLGAVGLLMVWYYFKFDRDELLSRLVGTDPKKIAWNWSMLNSVGPGVLLAAIACVSQAFPEVWQWLRYVAEPLARSSS